MRRTMALAVAALLATGAQVQAQAVRFTAEERAFVRSHGPWPPAFRPDPSNRLSGDPAAIAWGRELLADTRLSRGRDESCVSCHEPFGAFTDGKPAPKGLHRNTLALANLPGKRWYGWTGGSDTLWGQSILPILNPLEMDATPAQIARRVRENDGLRARFRAVTGVEPRAA